MLRTPSLYQRECPNWLKWWCLEGWEAHDSSRDTRVVRSTLLQVTRGRQIGSGGGPPVCSLETPFSPNTPSRSSPYEEISTWCEALSSRSAGGAKLLQGGVILLTVPDPLWTTISLAHDHQVTHRAPLLPYEKLSS